MTNKSCHAGSVVLYVYLLAPGRFILTRSDCGIHYAEQCNHGHGVNIDRTQKVLHELMQIWKINQIPLQRCKQVQKEISTTYHCTTFNWKNNN